MDPRLKQLLLENKAIAWLVKYGLYFAVFFLFWFLSRWHFREFASQIQYQKEIVTPDELYWVLQSLKFRQGIIDRNWPEMVQSAHPGFITMWLSALGTTVKLWFQPELQSEVDWLLQQTWVLPRSGELSQRLYPFLTPGRNALRLLVAGLWVAIYHLIQERIPHRPALILTLVILISDMWLLGLTSILHVDGLLALFSFITLLLILPKSDVQLHWYRPRRYLIAGIAAGAAILSKAPGLALLVIVPGILIVQQIIISWHNKIASRKAYLSVFVIFLIGLLLSIIFIAPVLFINPGHAYENIFALSSREIGFQAPTFFLGQKTNDPGILFYPLTIIFKQQAVVTIGLLILIIRFVLNRGRSHHLIFMGGCLAFSILFWLGLMVSDREFARYAIPIYLISTYIGAEAITTFVTNLRQPKQTHFLLRPATLFSAIVIIAFGGRLLNQLDPFVFTNLLVGGNRVGPSLMISGWGGEHGTAAAFSERTPEDERTIFTDNIPGSAPFINRLNRDIFLLTEQTAWLIKPQDIVLLSLENQQLNPERWLPAGHSATANEPTALLDNIPADQEPLHTIDSGGRPRVFIYSDFETNTIASGLTRLENGPFRFGDSLIMAESAVVKPNDDFNLYLFLRWRVRVANEEAGQVQAEEDGVIKLTITDKFGHVWIEREDPLIDIEDRPSLSWTPGRTYLTIHPLPLASDMPPENFQVNLNYFSADGSLTGVSDELGAFIGVTAELASLKVQVPSPQPPVAYPDGNNFIPQRGFEALGEVPDMLGQGWPLQTDIWVRHDANQEPLTSLTLEVGGESIEYPINTEDWQDGFIYRMRPVWRLPADLPAGKTLLSVNGAAIGEPIIEVVERNYELPSNSSRRGIEVDQLGEVHAFWLNREKSTANMFWQLSEPTLKDYTLFIQLLDTDANILHNVEMDPGRPTSQIVADEILYVETQLPAEIVSEAKFLISGFIDPITGQRLVLTRRSDGFQPPARHLLNNLKPDNE